MDRKFEREVRRLRRIEKLTANTARLHKMKTDLMAMKDTDNSSRVNGTLGNAWREIDRAHKELAAEAWMLQQQIVDEIDSTKGPGQ